MSSIPGSVGGSPAAEPTATLAVPPSGSATLLSRVTGFAYSGRGSEYFGIQFVNWVVTFATGGIFYPWARVRELRFTIGSVVVDGDPFTFHGRGGELFWGILKAWLLFVPLIVALSLAINLPGVDTGLRIIASVLLYALIIAIVAFTVIGSLRYRASRTSWRGIRFGFDGSLKEFGGAYALRLVAVFLTLGLAYAHVATWRRGYMLSHTRAGGERFGFDGVAADLFPRYVLCWLLAFPTLGMSMVWFHGHQQAYYWNHTTLAGGRFRSALTGGEWLGVSLVNGLLAALTLGLGAPFAYVNLHRAFFGRLTLEDADFARIRAAESGGSGMGEGAASLFDIDAGVDIG